MRYVVRQETSADHEEFSVAADADEALAIAFALLRRGYAVEIRGASDGFIYHPVELANLTLCEAVNFTEFVCDSALVERLAVSDRVLSRRLRNSLRRLRHIRRSVKWPGR